MKLILYIIPFAILLTLIIWSKNQFDRAIDTVWHANLQTEQRNSRQ